ncbi:hypothetical protein P280DRAFT_24393 [Massarina eburnea CBS 473.64]|uniref:Uncharacterized protein n=1 Tax=Massarina eburnea CBS 473.64 TaxID=1395130 RepID=A0A6A6RWR6_9PLEO|nr:hypothetical protein P280DRAFT_24393 [Massarina eburnea CBS 473.64]
MCWIALSPKEAKKRHGHNRRTSSAHESTVEEVVRIRHGARSPRLEKIHIVTPGISVSDEHPHYHHDHHPYIHHHHPHLHPHLHHFHPLHMHPLHLHPDHPDHHHHKLHGHGKRRHSPAPAPAPPPPSRSPSSCPSPREPVYRTQIVEPQMREMQETTRIALREARPERRDRGRLRRVAGYEVLGREVPWSWDCVSSVASESKRSGRNERKGNGGVKFPPFGSMDRWM